MASENFGFSLGVARRLVDDIAALAKSKRRLMDSSTIGRRGAFQLELARADATVRATRAFMKSELERVIERVEEPGSTLNRAEAMRAEASLSWSTEMLVQMGAKLFPFAGAGALHLESPIQRSLRSLIGSGQHYAATSEKQDARGRQLVSNAS